MALKDCCFIGKGKVYLRKKADFCPTSANPNPNDFYPAGNVAQWQVEISENVITQPDYQSKAGGIECSIREISDIQLNLTFACYSIRNLGLALLGTNEPVTAPVAVVAEPHTVQAVCEFVPLLQMPDLSVAPVVGDGTTTFVEGTDYVVTPTGTGSSDYEIVIDGINQADCKPFQVHLFNVRLSPASQADFIGVGEFATLEISGTVQKDACKINASGLEQYGTFKRAISA